VTPTPPALLLDTCAIINLSYCSPVATLFKSRYAERAGWTRAVREELTRQRSRKPPHPQAGRASNWAASWLPVPIEIVEPRDQIAIATIQQQDATIASWLACLPSAIGAKIGSSRSNRGTSWCSIDVGRPLWS
jgi:hypothetical protein